MANHIAAFEAYRAEINEEILGGSIFIPHLRHAFQTLEELCQMEAEGRLPEL